MLIEKAWAKLHGTFVRTEGNLPCFAYSHLTGVPSSNTSHESVKNKDKFFQELIAANSLNNILIASSGDKKSEKKFEQGIANGVSFYLLEIYEFNHEGEQVRICKMRNPWNKFEWKGEWSDDSLKWTSELRAKLQGTQQNDGILFMSFDEYMQVFKRTSICLRNDLKSTHTSFTYCFAPLQIEQKHPAYLTIKLQKDIDCER